MVCFCRSVVSNCFCDPMDYTMPGFAVHQLPELGQTHIHRVGDAIQPSHPLLSCTPSAFNLSHIWIFSNELAFRIMWPKYQSFSISPSNKYSGLIPFMIDWFDLLGVQGTFKSLFQHHSSKASILRYSAFCMVSWFSLKCKRSISFFC